jgi:hypothetical protein
VAAAGAAASTIDTDSATSIDEAQIKLWKQIKCLNVQ